MQIQRQSQQQYMSPLQKQPINLAPILNHEPPSDINEKWGGLSPKDSVTPEKAKQLFNDVQQLSSPLNKPLREGSIPFAFIEDGCYARSDKMVNFLESKYPSLNVIEVEVASNSQSLEVPGVTNNGEKCQVEWWYHVAPAVLVDADPNDDIPPELQVIDPSLFSEPVSVDKFMQTVGADTRKFEDLQMSPEQTEYDLSQYREALQKSKENNSCLAPHITQ